MCLFFGAKLFAASHLMFFFAKFGCAMMLADGMMA